MIEVPWDHIVNLWEFLSIHHEVGHDIEADLLLRPALRAAVEKALADAGLNEERIALWLDWQPEVFADLVAIQLAMLSTFFGLSYLTRPQRAVKTLWNMITKKSQETNMDQFLGTKWLYFKKRREVAKTSRPLPVVSRDERDAA